VLYLKFINNGGEVVRFSFEGSRVKRIEKIFFKMAQNDLTGIK